MIAEAAAAAAATAAAAEEEAAAAESTEAALSHLRCFQINKVFRRANWSGVKLQV